ncbi:hypothetical protein [Cytophaga aurantiaca]|uniref:hypothetical protein n=1 Tax=Cytophaga aurantiaca TaxID=29530 RepID=UPI0012F7F75F|nr:hypothetical protein [Cytophaga aurantiaca]
MNKLPTLLLTALLMFCNGRILAQIYDFEDGVIPVSWKGDRTNFQVSSTNEFQLNAPAGSTSSSLFWPSITTQNCIWEFYVKYAFGASSTNYATFYLFSTETDFSSASNVSYYLKIGGASGSTDKIELIYQQGSSKQVVLESRTGIVGGSEVTCRIQVSKNAMGMWELKTDTTAGHNYVKEASAQHWIANTFNYSGIRCLYSSTRRDKIYFDDIVIYEPFVIKSYAFENDSTLKIYFNQTLAAGLQPFVNEDFNMPYRLSSEGNYLLISFQGPLLSDTYRGTISNIFSSSGDSLSDTSFEIIKQLTYYVGQIRISEWMSDPSPSYGLPEVEWVELVNMSNEQIDLSKISISDPSSKIRLPAYRLNSDSVVIVCSLNTCKYFLRQNCIEVNALPSLNNSADSIFIWANDSLLIDLVSYNTSVMSTDFRSDGGYSIMRKTYPEECMLSQEIDFSQEHVGGSPGYISGVIISSTLAINATVLSVREVSIKMNTKVSGWDTSFYALLGVDHAVYNRYSYGTSYTLYLQQVLEEGNAYNLLIDSIRTCRNQMKYVNTEIEIIYPKQIEKNEVFVNEILYNPNSGGVDFIELYNTTSKYIQFRQTHFYNESNGVVQHLYFSDDVVIKPLGFVVLTSDTAILKEQYANTISANAFQITHFLSLPDTGGKLTWVAPNSDTLDQVYYGDSYHNPLLRNTEGYSLEKVSSSDSYFSVSNWTTSAVNATPGYINSQHEVSDKIQQKGFYCNPCHVTTNLNGVNDYVMLHLNEAAQGCFGSIGIYRLSGEKVLDLLVNQSLGNMNTIQWNGQQQGGALLEAGIYIAVAQWWTSNGQVYVSKIAISTSQY